MSKIRRPSIDKMFGLQQDKQNNQKEMIQLTKQRSALKRQSQRMFSEKRITAKNIGEQKSMKSISFKPVKEVFIINKKNEQDENFRDCCTIM